MKTRTKTILLIGLTFILGLLCGAVIQSILIRKEINRFSHRIRSPEGFIERFERIIQPTAEQRTEIRNVLKKHHREMMRFQNEFPSRMDSLRKDLESILTEEQLKKLREDRLMRTKRGDRTGRDRPGRFHDHQFVPQDIDSIPPAPPPPPPPV
ncbi:hypothetical protein JW948_13200 [bacterium]|nr:hypothetical protein [bacterium]